MIYYLCVLLSLSVSLSVNFSDRSRSEVDLSNLADGFSNDSVPGRCRSVPGLNDAVCSLLNASSHSHFAQKAASLDIIAHY